ncbi:MAG: HNH endonuclease [Verrucomicrobiota bacterium]
MKLKYPELAGLSKNEQSKRREAIYRARNVKAGLRCDGKPLAPVKPCGCRAGSCLKCRRPDNKGYWSVEEVQAMRLDYESGMSATAVERKHGVAKKGLKNIFERRGIPFRPFKVIPRQPNGSPVRYVPKTPAQLAALISKLDKLKVPEELKFEWRRWPLARRKAFIAQMRRRFPSTRPTGAFSKNVTPFVYGDEHVHQIAKEMNRGRNSRTNVIALKPPSEGLIYRGQIYFWDGETAYVKGCGWTPELGRPLLNHVVYAELHGPVPAKQTVIHKDGNKNNFAADNLVLRSMADCARMNAWHQHPDKFPGLARRIAVKSWLNRGKKMNAVSRAQVAAVLDNSTGGLFEQITRRKS